MKREFETMLWMGAAFGVAAALAVNVVSKAGTDADSVMAALRVTARWSFLLFWMAYVVRALAGLFGPAFAPLARRGREFGLAYAAAQLIHLGLVGWLYTILHRPPLTGSVLVFFATGIVFTYLLAALSFGGLSGAMGPRLWRLVRILGMNYILIAFAYDFVLSVNWPGIAHQSLSFQVEYVPFAAMCVAAPLLSLAAAARRRLGMRHAAA